MLATSSSVPARPIGITLTTFSISSGLLFSLSRYCGVTIAQGATVLTVMPSRANSRAMHVLIPCMPHLAALLPARSNSPLCTLSPPIFLMLPHPASLLRFTLCHLHQLPLPHFHS